MQSAVATPEKDAGSHLAETIDGHQILRLFQFFGGEFWQQLSVPATQTQATMKPSPPPFWPDIYLPIGRVSWCSSIRALGCPDFLDQEPELPGSVTKSKDSWDSAWMKTNPASELHGKFQILGQNTFLV